MLEFALQAEQFRAKAAVCFARSKGLHDPEYRQIFYDLAIEWLAMAAEAARDRGDSLLQDAVPASEGRAV